MQKHGREDRQDGVARWRSAFQPKIHVAWYESKLGFKARRGAGSQGKFKQKYQNIQGDEKVIDKGRGGAGSVIAEGDHLILMLMIIMLDIAEMLKWTES
jgi:hypothetical protein